MLFYQLKATKERELEVITPRKSDTKPVVYTLGNPAKPETKCKRVHDRYFHFDGFFFFSFATVPLIVSRSLEVTSYSLHLPEPHACFTSTDGNRLHSTNVDAQKTAGCDQSQSLDIARQLGPVAITSGCTLRRQPALKLQRPCNDPSLCGAKRQRGRFACVVFNQQFSVCTPFMHYG